METPRRQRAATADGETPPPGSAGGRYTPQAGMRLDGWRGHWPARAQTRGQRAGGHLQPGGPRCPLPARPRTAPREGEARGGSAGGSRERKLPSSGATVAVSAESVVASHAVTAGRRHLPRAFTRAEHAPAKARAQRLRPGGAGGERFACPPETRKETRVCTTENSRTIDLCNTYEPQKRHVEQTQPDTERRAVARFTRTGATVRSNP